MASSFFFALGSLLAAIAKNFTVILIGYVTAPTVRRKRIANCSVLYRRTIQGIGGGGIMTLGEILVTDLVPLSVRGVWFGYLGSMWAIGSVSGPLVGGAFAQNVSWRW